MMETETDYSRQYDAAIQSRAESMNLTRRFRGISVLEPAEIGVASELAKRVFVPALMSNGNFVCESWNDDGTEEAGIYNQILGECCEGRRGTLTRFAKTLARLVVYQVAYGRESGAPLDFNSHPSVVRGSGLSEVTNPAINMVAFPRRAVGRRIRGEPIS